MNNIKVIVKVSRAKRLLLRLDEAKYSKVGKHNARRDLPHFQGDEIHGHCKLSGGKEVSWTFTGTRRHPNKFPADDKIPSDAKKAIANVLGVDSDSLESYWGFDDIEGQKVFILQEKNKRGTKS